ncbi:hypothetical protein L599_002000000050 [Luteimonas sp. J16]|jgi:hypothetical protein|uniref:hypothetical protein n=1 Tax=unclassified Luteimonas TaxID=2629088 RepID=UPI00047A0FDA|nr:MULTISPECIES: hypothetical protein [unclassified Luteimonas]TWG91906.1 hypothetical protein L599_002000000050 [Luteimonas sp. J16]
MRLPTIPALPFAAVAVAAATPHGGPLPGGEPEPVSVAIAGFDAHAGQAHRFSGPITSICQAGGGWRMLEDDGKGLAAAQVEYRIIADGVGIGS